MSLTTSAHWMYSSGGSFYDYEIENSLRFNDGVTNYLSRTPSSAGNRKTWTWSGWVKKGNVSDLQVLFSAYTSNADSISLYYATNQTITVSTFAGTGVNFVFNGVYRDPSAWQNIVLVFDTTQATGSDRIKLYVNGVKQTTSSTAAIPSLNSDWTVNNTAIHYLGRTNGTLYSLQNSYMAEVNFLDGTAVTDTQVGNEYIIDEFGETKSGVWIPKDTSGLTYGTNGFRLEFGDSAAIGDDTSGNGNDWTANNLSAHDVVPDSPTNNYAVVNPLARSAQDFRVTLSEGNLNISAVTNGDSNFNTRFATIPLPSSGKYYAECRTYVISNNGNQTCFGVVDPDAFDANEPSSKTLYNFADGEGFDGFNINLFVNTLQAYSGGATSGSQITGLTATSYILKLALDIDNGKVFLGYDGVWLNSADPAAGSGEIATRTFTTSDVIAIQTTSNTSGNNNGSWLNFGQDSTFGGNLTAGGNSDANGYGDFAYPVPNNFLALNSANLPEPDITPLNDDIPEDYFNTVLYTGNGSTQSITGVGFQPDWTWVKSRNVGGNHILQDAVRGVGKGLFSDLTNAENSNMGGMTSFDSDGFSLDGTIGELNGNTRTFAAWNWKAGSTAVSNTDGSITSSVSANTEAKFSIVSFAVPASGTFTIGHGLGTKPAMVITKGRGSADNWAIYHKAISSLNENSYILLNKTNATGTATDIWGTAQPTSTVMGMKAGTTLIANQEAIAYCFAEVEGYSKFGSYTGNANANGTFVYTGFRPAFVITKKSDGISNWNIIDNHRPNEYNPANNGLLANENLSESILGTSYPTDLLSNGFKFYTNGGGFNGTGTHIYMAFAEMPTKYALAR